MFNEVTLIGNLGQDPEIRAFDDGKKVARISLATNKKYKNEKEEEVKQTQWHNVIGWGYLADYMEKFLKKGDMIFVKGEIAYRSYVDETSSETKYVTDINIFKINKLGQSNKNGNYMPSEPPKS